MDPALLVARPRQEEAKNEVHMVPAPAREVRPAGGQQKMVLCGECGAAVMAHRVLQHHCTGGSPPTGCRWRRGPAGCGLGGEVVETGAIVGEVCYQI